MQVLFVIFSWILKYFFLAFDFCLLKSYEMCINYFTNVFKMLLKLMQKNEKLRFCVIFPFILTNLFVLYQCLVKYCIILRHSLQERRMCLKNLKNIYSTFYCTMKCV